jgi:hypothetical protein
MIDLSQRPEPKPEGLDYETSQAHLNVLGHDNSAPDDETGGIDLCHRSALTP